MIATTGGVEGAAEPVALALAASGARCLMSFGIAGGLSPLLRPGALVLARAVTDGTREWPCEARWISRHRRALRLDQDGAHQGTILGTARIVASVADKAGLYVETGALAVDLESLGVARAAEATNLPFIVLRAVADPASRALPPAALVGLKPDGGADLPAVLGSLARRPGQLPALIRVARDSAAALKALREAVDRLGEDGKAGG